MQGMGATGATRGTRGTGRSEGSVGVSSGGIELGLKVGGIGQLGISTDYGGGIVIGIFGQKIVWGREGGKIHYNFGGLEVIVEARNCVVVETRKIFGQVTGSHVYPDPGCKLPPEPASNSEPNLPPPTKIMFPPGDPLAIRSVIIQGIYTIYSEYRFDGGAFRSGGTTIGVARISEVQQNSELGLLATFQGSYTNRSRFGTNPETIETVIDPPYTGSVVTPFTARRFYKSLTIFSGILGRLNAPWHLLTGRYDHIQEYTNDVLTYHGNSVNSEKGDYVSPIYTSTSAGYFLHIQGATINFELAWIDPPAEKAPKIILPSAGNQPPMLESCCEALSADIADIKEVLATKEILAGKMTFPWKWRMPGGEGEEILLDYPSLIRAVTQMIDHLGVHPPKLTIKDINNAIAGDQSLTNQFPSVTQAFEALMAKVWDANADVDTLTNFLYRLAWLSVQQSFNLASLTGSVESLKDMVGGETEPLETTLTTPFNIEAGTAPKKAPPSGKGFGKPSNNGKGAIDNRIEAHSEMATESMLPEFLKIRENPILVDSYIGKQDLFDILLLIRADLEKIKNRG